MCLSGKPNMIPATKDSEYYKRDTVLNKWNEQ
jgi:hypothetical protein